MGFKKPKAVAVSVFAGVAIFAATTTYAEAHTADPNHNAVETAISSSVFNQTVFAGSYVTVGATNGTINGDVASGLYVTTGAASQINGDIVAVAAVTLGEGATTSGTIDSGAAITLGAGATSGTQTALTPQSVSVQKGQLGVAQSTLSALSSSPIPPGNWAANATYTPGVYKVAGLLSVTADVNITLNAGGQDNAVFVFNIDNYLSFGAGVTVSVTNDPNGSAIIIWNAAGGYISIGAGADIVGTVMAHTYVSTGAGSTVKGIDSECGGAAYSTTSYVTVGAGASVGTGAGPCRPVVAPPCTYHLHKGWSSHCHLS
jgi:hypothetical protein